MASKFQIKNYRMFIFLTILLILSIMLEGTITMLPLTFVCLLCFTIFRRDASVLPLAFFAGLFIDIFRVQQIGETSLFYICYLFLILLYKKKYEIYSIPFVMLSTFFGAFFYLLLFQNPNALILSLVSAGIAVVLFAGISLVTAVKGRNKTAFRSV
jgi:hypothetical protein